MRGRHFEKIFGVRPDLTANSTNPNVFTPSHFLRRRVHNSQSLLPFQSVSFPISSPLHPTFLHMFASQRRSPAPSRLPVRLHLTANSKTDAPLSPSRLPVRFHLTANSKNRRSPARLSAWSSWCRCTGLRRVSNSRDGGLCDTGVSSVRLHLPSKMCYKVLQLSIERCDPER